MDSLRKLQVLAAEFERLGEQGVRSAKEMAELVLSLQEDFRQLTRQRKELSSLYEVARDLTGASELGCLLESIIDKALELVKAERGFVVLARPEGGYYVAAARRFDSAALDAQKEGFSSSLIERVLQSREPILTTNVQADERFELSQSIILQDIRSVLAVPLIARGELLGAIYVDTRMETRHFSEADLRLLQMMASQAAMAIRGAKLYEDLKESNEQLQSTLEELREAQEQLIQAERLAAVGRLAASVAHELRSPLMVMRNSLYYLERLVSLGKLDNPEILRRYFGKLDAEIERQSKIINDLLFFSRNRPRRLSDVDVNALLEETLLRVSMPESITVHKELEPSLGPLRADGDQLQQVFLNLITNAVQAMPEGGVLTLRSRAEEGGYVVIEVSDTGVGIPEENIDKLFEPFFTTKPSGIGLGLSVVQSIVEGHKGYVRVSSTPGEGTTFSVFLPLQLIG
ncbi:MAG: GAF domain-containing protein [Anaerolineae bacterium]|nr:GAF domain-containing protein [Anaerolineae bacterium]